MHTWFRSWLIKICRSTYDISFYSELVSKKWPTAIWHLYGVLWLTSLLMTLAAVVSFVAALPTVRLLVAVAKEDLPTLYPAELIVTVENGEVRTNVQEPYRIEFSDRWREAMGSSGVSAFKHLVTIDTKAHVEEYERYESVVLVTRTAVAYPSKISTTTTEEGSVTSIQTSFITFNKLGNIVLDKEHYDRVAAMILPWVPYASALLFAVVVVVPLTFPFMVAGARLLGYVLYLVPAAGVLWVIARFMRKRREYGELYRLSFCGLTLPILYGFLEWFAGFHVPYLFTTIFLGWMVYVVATYPRQVTSG